MAKGWSSIPDTKESLAEQLPNDAAADLFSIPLDVDRKHTYAHPCGSHGKPKICLPPWLADDEDVLVHEYGHILCRRATEGAAPHPPEWKHTFEQITGYPYVGAGNNMKAEGCAEAVKRQLMGEPLQEGAPAKAKAFKSPRAMLQWQYREIIAELGELQRHASDPTCPCVQADSGEYCLMKHALGIHTLAKETMVMDPEHAELLGDLAEQSLGTHHALAARVVHGKAHQEEKDVVEWSRQWRKSLEPLYYGSSTTTEGAPFELGDWDKFLERFPKPLPQTTTELQTLYPKLTFDRTELPDNRVSFKAFPAKGKAFHGVEKVQGVSRILGIGEDAERAALSVMWKLATIGIYPTLPTPQKEVEPDVSIEISEEERANTFIDIMKKVAESDWWNPTVEQLQKHKTGEKTDLEVLLISYTIHEVLRGFNTLAEAETAVLTLSRSGGLRYTSQGWPYGSDAISYAIGMVREHPFLSPFPKEEKPPKEKPPKEKPPNSKAKPEPDVVVKVTGRCTNPPLVGGDNCTFNLKRGVPSHKATGTAELNEVARKLLADTTPKVDPTGRVKPLTVELGGFSFAFADETVKEMSRTANATKKKERGFKLCRHGDNLIHPGRRCLGGACSIRLRDCGGEYRVEEGRMVFTGAKNIGDFHTHPSHEQQPAFTQKNHSTQDLTRWSPGKVVCVSGKDVDVINCAAATEKYWKIPKRRRSPHSFPYLHPDAPEDYKKLVLESRRFFPEVGAAHDFVEIEKVQEANHDRALSATQEGEPKAKAPAKTVPVRISGRCQGEACTIKVSATETVSAQTTQLSDLPEMVSEVGQSMKKAGGKAGGKHTDTTFAYSPSGARRYDFRYRLVEASELVASHDSHTFSPTPGYPPELQPRLRERAATQLQVSSMAANLIPEVLLTEYHSIDRGAPIIGEGHIVESGNGRVMAIKRAYLDHPDVADHYRRALGEKAGEYGQSAMTVAGMKEPVLVRERLTKVDRRAFALEANAATTIAPSSIEIALADAKAMSIGDVMELEVREGQGIEDAVRAPANKGFVSRFIQGLPQNEQAKMIDADGNLNQDGVRRMVMALFVVAFPGESGLKLAERFFESTEASVRNTFNGIARALGALAQVESLTAAGQRHPELAIGEDLAKAVSVFAAIKSTPAMTVEKYLSQSQIFDRQLSPFQERLLGEIDRRARSGKTIGEMLSGYAAGVMRSAPPGQASMLGGMIPDKDELLGGALALVEGAALLPATVTKKVDTCNLSPKEVERVYSFRPLRDLVAYGSTAGTVQICQAGMVPGIIQVAVRYTKAKVGEAQTRLIGMGRRIPGFKQVHTPYQEFVGTVVMPAEELRAEELLGRKQEIDVPPIRGESGEQHRLFAPVPRCTRLPETVEGARISRKDWENIKQYSQDMFTTPPEVCPVTAQKPSDCKLELFPFQAEGVAWLLQHDKALLADDMGLGKTPQAIHWGIDKVPALVVAPTALTMNWEREIQRWRTNDTVLRLDGSNRIPAKLPDWTVITYGQVERYLPQLRVAGFRAIIADEAHYIKNMDARRTRNLLELVAPTESVPGQKTIPTVLAVTGTPIINRPSEIFSLLLFLGKKQRSDYKQFLHTYTEHQEIKGRMVFTGAKNLDQLNEFLSGFMLRRLKVDVLTQLPPKVPQAMLVPITTALEYQEAEKNFLKWVREKKGDQAAFRASQAEIITRMNALRQIAARGKVQPLADWLKPCSTGGTKAIVFSSFKDPLEELHELRPESALYTGELGTAARQEIVDAFQAEPEPCYFLGTIGAAGVGITLTASNRVVFLDQPWTPGGRSQAEDRAHRIGQQDPVWVIHFLAKGTIDERMMEILAQKEEVIAQAVDGKTKDEAAKGSIAMELLKSFSEVSLGSPELYVPEEWDPDIEGTPPSLKEATMIKRCELVEGGHFQKLLPKALKKKLPALYSQENVSDPMVIAKYFAPWTSWTWYAIEFDGEDRFFGLVKGDYLAPELGDFLLSELAAVKGPYGLKVERDQWFRSTPLSEVRQIEGSSGPVRNPLCGLMNHTPHP